MADIPEDIRITAYAMAMRLVDRDRDSGENADVIAEAILAERERCGKIADQYVWDDHALAQATDIGRAVHHQSVEIAAAIRAPGIPS